MRYYDSILPLSPIQTHMENITAIDTSTLFATGVALGMLFAATLALAIILKLKCEELNEAKTSLYLATRANKNK